MIVKTGEVFLDKIMEGLSGDEACVFDPEIILSNPNSDFNLEITKIKGFGITCDYGASYCTAYQLDFEVELEEYLDVLKNMKDMEATITLRAWDPIYLEERMDQDPIVYTLKVIVENQEDIDKKFNVNALGDTDGTNDGERDPQTPEQAALTFPVTLNLIEPEIFDIRHVQMNVMMTGPYDPETKIQHGVKLLEVLHWIAQQFKAEQVNIAEVNNDKEIVNFVIPPTHDISTIFPFLQERYGLFSEGLGYYFENKTFYIYPLYNHNRDKSTEKGVVHIINGPSDYFLGLDRYHTKKDDDLLIVSTTKKEQKALTTSGVENEGNVHISTNIDEVKDQFVQVQENGDVKMTKSPTTTVALGNTDANMVGEAQNVKFCGERSNIFASTSTFASINGSVMSAGWNHAYPGLIKPGHICTYHYQKKQGEYHTQDGTILKVVYMGTPQPGIGNKPWLVFNAMIGMHMEPDKSEETVQTYQV